MPDTAQWVVVTQDTTLAIITDLEILKYFFQVRAIDRSGNVRTSAGDSTAVLAKDFPEAGWSNVTPDWETATPTLVGAADVSFNSVLTSILTTNKVNADHIQTGTLSIGGTPNTPDYLLVYNGSGQEIGRWDANGILIKDPANTQRQIRIVNGAIEFSSDGGVTWATAITAEGIKADAITFGTSIGGHNLIPNSQFELAVYAQLSTKIWTLTADWDDATSMVDLDYSTSSLQLLSSSY